MMTEQIIYRNHNAYCHPAKIHTLTIKSTTGQHIQIIHQAYMISTTHNHKYIISQPKQQNNLNNSKKEFKWFRLITTSNLNGFALWEITRARKI
jgi:hypothetical protein